MSGAFAEASCFTRHKRRLAVAAIFIYDGVSAVAKTNG
jgi:hypothetical protein